jgi:hypothetical protein
MTYQPEPCMSCGDDTSAGSPFFSDRLVDRSEGKPRYMCSLCVQLARGGREVHGLTDEEDQARERRLRLRIVRARRPLIRSVVAFDSPTE